VNNNSSKVIFSNPAEVRDYFSAMRSKGKKIVTTNGCFDIIHAGHIAYLYEAKSFGDILVVGLNSDESVRLLKGPSRPLQTETDRLEIMSALRMVDGAFIFREKDPRAFLDIIRPDVHVKGGDYSRDILEREVVENHGGRVEIVSFLAGHSTTSIVNRMIKKEDND